jgi:hypothetical protein
VGVGVGGVVGGHFFCCRRRVLALLVDADVGAGLDKAV